MGTNLQSRRFPFGTAHRFTLEEYHRLVEEGLLAEQPRSVELLDGRIVPVGGETPNPRHLDSSRRRHLFLKMKA